MFPFIRRTLFAAPLVFAVAALSTAATPAFAADGTFEKAFSFNGAPAVSVFTGSGYVHVTIGSDNQIHVIGHVHANSGWLSAGNPEAIVRQIVANPPITQTGSIVDIGRRDSAEIYNNVSISYDISTPRSTLLTTHTGSGSIEVAGISGSVTAQTGSGTIHLTLANSTDVHAQTGSGSIRIEGATGALHAHTGSGSVNVAGNVGTGWNLSTGSGGIRVQLPDNARFSLDASTGSGSVHVDQPIVIQSSMNRHHVSGSVNGGGPILHASTGSGSITISGNATGAELR